ncbi:MAG: hypothetical protein KAS72_07385 [Phycisphaerales bacterium]|nr:hypothetical protein [Phycisphaerales bacterium]
MAATLLLLVASPLYADEAQPATTPEPGEPTLDELLGIEDEEPQVDDDAIDRPAEADVSLDEPDVDPFIDALDKMRQAAERLGPLRDTGLATQRLQADVMARLEVLLANAAQSSQSQPSPSDGSRDNEVGSQDTMNQPSGEQEAAGNTAGRRIGPPEQREGRADGTIDETGLQWGNLPPRLRDSLLQGSVDVFSSMYRTMTEAYYERLAEENKQ